MAKSSIEWTDETWNPVSGCTRASAGCDHCYAVTMTKRLEAMGQQKYANLVNLGKNHFNGTVKCHEDELLKPLRWKRPRRCFVNSMSDLFHRDVPFDFIDKVFAVMALCPHITFQILTKRPDRMAEYFSVHCFNIADGKSYVDASPICEMIRAGCGGDFELPLPNVWLGTSIENQEVAWRASYLNLCPADVKFLSIEPLIGPLNPDTGLFKPCIICGGSGRIYSGHGHGGAGHCETDSRICRSCVQGRVAVPGTILSENGLGDRRRRVRPRRAPDCDHLPNQWQALNPNEDGRTAPNSANMIRVGKKAAGRVLDGRTWDEFPEAAK